VSEMSTALAFLAHAGASREIASALIEGKRLNAANHGSGPVGVCAASQIVTAVPSIVGSVGRCGVDGCAIAAAALKKVGRTVGLQPRPADADEPCYGRNPHQ
jgi:hypothetical protein